jgi:ferritin-like metal-binding protein YciE
MSELTTIKDLLESEIKDLYSAEKQLTKAIPKMAKGSNNEELASAFKAHLKETEGQITRLERVAKLLDTTPTGKKCKGMEGVIEEGAEVLEEEGDENVLDLGIIGAVAALSTTKCLGTPPPSTWLSSSATAKSPLC